MQNSQDSLKIFSKIWPQVLSLMPILLTVCVFVCNTDCDKFSPAATTIMLMFLVFESILFGLFTAIMSVTQMSAIVSDLNVSCYYSSVVTIIATKSKSRFFFLNCGRSKSRYFPVGTIFSYDFNAFLRATFKLCIQRPCNTHGA